MALDLIVALPILLYFIMILGIVILKGDSFWGWTLKKRLHLRHNITGNKNIIKITEIKNQILIKINPLSVVSTMLNKYRQQKMDREIFEAIIFLRNLASIKTGVTSNTDYIIERLSEHEGLLKPVYTKMLNLLRINKKEEAIAIFNKKVHSSSSKEFARMLIQWDRINPAELMETLISYEQGMKAIRITEQKKRDEIISDLIYFPVVINILVIFVNFIYIAYFIDQKEMLQMFM